MIKFTSYSWKTTGRISAKSIAKQLGISRERVGSIVDEDLFMRKLPATWVLKCIKADQSVNGASHLSNVWNFFGASDPKVVAMSLPAPKIPSAKIR
jgi:hypothetical protein